MLNYNNLVTSTIQRWNQLSGKSFMLDSVEQLTPDASGRLYYRARSSDKNVIVMYFVTKNVPEAVNEKEAKLSDESFVGVQEIFISNNVSVPEILFNDLSNSILIVEDVGNQQLINYANGDFKFYKLALSELVKIQNISNDNGHFIFKRRFDHSVFVREMSEFTDFLLESYRPRIADLGYDFNEVTLNFNQLYQDVSKKILSFPFVLSHRDFHSWNIHVVDNQVRIIDFQDALMAPRLYDFISLLNDRGSDIIIGEVGMEMLKNSFSSLLNIKRDEFDSEYYLTLLQRDLKVAGRFEKLALKGMESYRKFIPHTVSRIENGLSYLSDRADISSSKYCMELIKKVFKDQSEI